MLISKIKYLFKLLANYNNWLYIVICRFFDKPIERIILNNGTIIIGGNKSLTIDIVDEIFVRNVYNPIDFEIKPNDIVADIGANTGIFSLYAALKGAKKIIAIEPLSENLKYIRENFSLNNLRNPLVINKAISNKNGRSKLYLSDYDSHGLLFNQNNLQKFSKYIYVDTLKFSSLLKKYNLSKIDFLKIDCEGSEGYIFSETNNSHWKNIKKISIEYHNGVSILNNNQIIKRLHTFGYKTKKMESDNLFGYIYAWR